MHRPIALAALAVAAALAAGSAHAETRSITTDIWVDNWFAMHANGEPVLEDSVSITTERSFNAETSTFTVELPATIAIEAKDFKENDTGLEYIGTRRQQMGDGGMIAQFHDADSDALLAVTSSDMRCLVVQRAPVDRACADEADPIAGEGACAFETTDVPSGWTAADFDDSDWPMAVEHGVADVGPKDGYDRISWADAARLVWSADLVQDNTLLCRLTIAG